MAGEERTFQIQLEGLIQLLAQNLYADPDVFLREMIQNAHDSIRRRAELAAERGEAELPSPRNRSGSDRGGHPSQQSQEFPTPSYVHIQLVHGEY